MDNQPATTSGAWVRFWPWLGVLFVLLFAAGVRFRLLDTPLERDEGEYAYAGQLILQGIPPYELAYNMKLPGTYAAYALGMAVFGETSAGVHLTLLAANALTIVFVFLLARKLFGAAAGLVACASYAVMSASVSVLGMAAHATHFVVLFGVPATLLLWTAGQGGGNKIFFASGLLYGLGFLMEQQGICFCAFGWLFLICRAVREKAIFSTDLARRCFAFGAGMFLPFALTCLALAGAGVFARFWFWCFTYAGSYVTLVPLAEGWSHLAAFLHETFPAVAGFWLVLAVGLPAALAAKGFRPQTLFAAAFGIFSFLGVAVGLYFRTHYFVLALPAMGVLLGAAVAGLQRALRFPVIGNVLQTIPRMFFALALAWFVFYQSAYFFRLTPVQWCDTVYAWDPFQEAVVAADYLRAHCAPDARFAVIGSEPEIYFYARRHSATGYIYTYALMEPQPNALKMQRDMIREIETNRPEFLVYVKCGDSWLFKPHSDLTLLNWFAQYGARFYEPSGFVRKNAAGDVEGVWGGAAQNQPKPTGQYIAIYQRKPAEPETGKGSQPGGSATDEHR